jgi:hypothetical protein
MLSRTPPGVPSCLAAALAAGSPAALAVTGRGRAQPGGTGAGRAVCGGRGIVRRLAGGSLPQDFGRVLPKSAARLTPDGGRLWLR